MAKINSDPLKDQITDQGQIEAICPILETNHMDKLSR